MNTTEWRMAEFGDDCEYQHHEYCMMSRNIRTTACQCSELRAADKAAAAEFKADCEQDR